MYNRLQQLDKVLLNEFLVAKVYGFSSSHGTRHSTEVAETSLCTAPEIVLGHNCEFKIYISYFKRTTTNYCAGNLFYFVLLRNKQMMKKLTYTASVFWCWMWPWKKISSTSSVIATPVRLEIQMRSVRHQRPQLF